MTQLDAIRDWVLQGDTASITSVFEELQSLEIVHLMSHLDKDEQMDILRLLEPEDAASIMEELPEAQAAQIVEQMDAEDAAAILNEMPSDEQVDILNEISELEAEEVISQMRPEEAADVRRLIDYDSDVAGGLMVSEYLHYREDVTVGQATLDMRRRRKAYEKLHIHYLYITNARGRLMGVLSIQDLLLNVSSTRLGEIFTGRLHVVGYSANLDELQDFFHSYDYYSAPVIDENQSLLGVVLRKDLWEAVAEQKSNDLLEVQGIVGGDELRTMPVWLRAKRRFSWLSVNILLNILAASVIAFHQETLSSVIALAVFLPIISDMSGCSGNQAIAVSMREISLGVIKPHEVLRVWRQEISVGLINGLALGLLLALASYLWKGSLALGLVVGSALMLNTLVAVSIGGTVPLLLKKRKLDPALASGPLLTTITDMVGFFLTLSFAALALDYLT